MREFDIEFSNLGTTRDAVNQGSRWALSKKRRAIEIFIAFALLPLCMLVSIFLAIGIFLDSRGSPIISQRRVGMYGTEFSMFKLRTMVNDAESEKFGGIQWSKLRDPRITRLGKIIRRTRLDEILQIFNVINGDMSFIGPRPERREIGCEVEKTIKDFSKRISVKPGITGMAQVEMDYVSDIDNCKDRHNWDMHYIHNSSPLLDIKIILKTIAVVLLMKGR